MENKKEIYEQLGVSSKKEDVHKAIKDTDKGFFPGAFCKIVRDVRGEKDFFSVFHSDGAGTKPNLAYMYYKETGNAEIFKGLVRDAIVMNLDDVLCIGATGDYFISNTISRNKNRIPGNILSIIIKEFESYCNYLSKYNVNMIFCGGETADVGDVVKTLLVDASLFTTIKKKDIIDASKIKPDDVIVGFASYGKSKYEDDYNSGIGCNGLTLARHGVLYHDYFKKYPECYDSNLEENLVFFGKYALTDKIPGLQQDIGKALLSPTRTYAPIIKEVLKKFKKEIHGIIHNTGGGQTKVLRFGKGIKYVKNNLFKIPKIFEIIQNSSEISWQEMYQVFNMGHRLEIYCDESIGNEIIKISRKFDVDAKIIGNCEESPKKNKNVVEIKSEFGAFTYE